jgi:hypothetical protein
MSIYRELCAELSTCRGAYQTYWMTCVQIARDLARGFGKYTDAPSAYKDQETGKVHPYVTLSRHKIVGYENIPEDTDYQTYALDDDGNGWRRFCLGITLEHGTNVYPKRQFAFFLKIRVENGHVYTKLLDRSYQDFDVNTDDGKELLFKHMIEMLHISFQSPPEQGLLQQQFGVFFPQTETPP